MTAELAHRTSHRLFRTSRINNPKGTFMKCASVVKAAAAVAVVVGLAGCTDLKPLQAEIADLKAQVAKAQGDVAAAKSSADSGQQRRPVGRTGGQRCAEHGEPGVGCGSCQPVVLRCDQREDRSHVQAVGLEVSESRRSRRSMNAAHTARRFFCLGAADAASVADQRRTPGEAAAEGFQQQQVAAA